MPQAFADVAVLRQGDPQGNRMVIRLTTHGGGTIHAIGVPQDWPSRTGPTWAYLFESDGVTLIDPGAHGSFRELADGITQCGYAVGDIDRVIVSHGHSDHDGSIAQIVDSADVRVRDRLEVTGRHLVMIGGKQIQVVDTTPFLIRRGAAAPR